MSARSRAISFIRLAWDTFIKSQTAATFSSTRYIWYLANIISNNITSQSFSPLFDHNGATAVTFISELYLGEMFSQNTILDVSVKIPPTSSASDFNIPAFKIKKRDVFNCIFGWNPQKSCGHDGVLHILLNNSTSVLTLYQVRLFATQVLHTYVYLSFLLELFLNTTCVKKFGRSNFS